MAGFNNLYEDYVFESREENSFQKFVEPTKINWWELYVVATNIVPYVIKVFVYFVD